MWQWIHKAGSAQICYRWSRAWQPWLMAACLIALIYGLIGGLYLAPPDYQQGDVFRIMYLHVPNAILSLMVYVVMTVAAIIYFIWKINVADLVVKVSLPIGAVFTLLTLITGSIWGKPTWGTFWIWDARLTSELILLFIYLAIMALRSAINDPKASAKAGNILTIVGVINIPIIHYSVDWWNTLHQGASLDFTNSSIAPSMLHPLLVMIVAFVAFYGWYLCVQLRAELLLKNPKAGWPKQVLKRGGEA